MKAIINCNVFTGEEVTKEGFILVDNNKILTVGTGNAGDVEKIDLLGKNISAGFIDAQLNGGYTRYFSQTPDTQTLSEMLLASSYYGTPYFLPTLITSPEQVILDAIDAVKSFRETHPTVLGMHLEGPFINPDKRGAHSATIIRQPTNQELKTIIKKGSDVIKVMTIAPECFSDYQLDMLLETGIVLSAGHSMMTYEQAQYYFDKGIQLVTHLYNAMTQFGHRNPGMIGAVFNNENVFAPIILDGGHVHFAAAKAAYIQKREKLFLISDASFLGRKKTSLDWKGLHIKMVDGYYRDNFGNLAGAAISLPEAAKNAIIHLKLPLQSAIEMCTSRVAQAIKMADKIGYIKPGYPAVFTTFDNQLKEIKTLIL